MAYGCTSASATIGEEKIFDQLSIRQVAKDEFLSSKYTMHYVFSLRLIKQLR